MYSRIGEGHAQQLETFCSSVYSQLRKYVAVKVSSELADKKRRYAANGRFRSCNLSIEIADKGKPCATLNSQIRKGKLWIRKWNSNCIIFACLQIKTFRGKKPEYIVLCFCTRLVTDQKGQESESISCNNRKISVLIPEFFKHTASLKKIEKIRREHSSACPFWRS